MSDAPGQIRTEIVLDQAFSEFLIGAYGGGLREDYQTVSAVFEAEFEWTLGEIAGNETVEMRTLISRALRHVTEEGPEAVRRCARAFYLALPWHGPLRAWIAERLPEDAPLVSEEVYAAERQRVTKDRVAAVTAGIDTAVAARLSERISGDARGKLHAVAENLAQMKGFKGIHDVLHTVQTGPYLELTGLSLRAGAPDDEVVVETQLFALQGALERIETCCLDLPPENAEWSARLRVVIEKLESRKTNPSARATALYLLREMLRQGLMWFDLAIVNAAARIPFTDAVDLLTQAAGLAGLNAEQVEALKKAAVDLAALDRSLTRVRELHRLWQQVDAKLWPLDDDLRGQPNAHETINIIWDTEVRPKLEAIRKAAPDLWDDSVHQVGLEAEQAIDSTRPENAQAYAAPLRSFVRHARLQFLRVDRTLLEQCRAIAQLSQPITAFLR